MKVGVITGTGTEEWPRLTESETKLQETPFGSVEVTSGRFVGTEMLHISRHGRGHPRLSNHVEHRANLAGLIAAGADCLLSMTVCGSVDEDVKPGSVVVFDDLYFPSNRFADGALCSWHDRPGEAGRGHWIFDNPYSEPLRRVVLSAAEGLGLPTATGCYGHVDGPRFNTRTEIAALGQLGVTAVSQTAGPEVVLAGEAQLPMALVGYVTDFANGVGQEPEPVEALLARIAASTEVFATLLAEALPAVHELRPAGIVYRFEP